MIKFFLVMAMDMDKRGATKQLDGDGGYGMCGWFVLRRIEMSGFGILGLEKGIYL